MKETCGTHVYCQEIMENPHDLSNAHRLRLHLIRNRQNIQVNSYPTSLMEVATAQMSVNTSKSAKNLWMERCGPRDPFIHDPT